MARKLKLWMVSGGSTNYMLVATSQKRAIKLYNLGEGCGYMSLNHLRNYGYDLDIEDFPRFEGMGEGVWLSKNKACEKTVWTKVKLRKEGE